ncbi:MAG: hypothetical protein ABL895_17195 [Cyclobacteriaceae bacterium]
MTQTGTSQTAEQIERTASFLVKAPIEKTFPLFGPIREKEWAAGWEPQVIYSRHPEVEEHMIFKTAGNNPEEKEYVWVVAQYKPAEFFIEYQVSTHERIWFITVKCKPQQENTLVSVTYSYTGLTYVGNRINQESLAKMFAHDLKDWEEAINFYLSTGKRLE